MSKLSENREKIAQILEDIEQLPEDRYYQGKEEGRSEGYEQGLTDGKTIGYENALAKRTDLVVEENGTYEPQGDSTGFRIVSVNVQAKSENRLAAYFGRTLTHLVESDFDGVTTLPIACFRQNNALISVVIPNSVVSMGSSDIFAYCKNLSFVSLSNALTNIPSYCFRSCSSLKTLIVRAKKPPSLWALTPFYECTALEEIIVPIGCGDAYKSATNWSAYADKIVEGDV